MSDVLEMIKEARRAFELGDHIAAADILDGLIDEAHRCEMGELGDDLAQALSEGHWYAIDPVLCTMADKAAWIDHASHQLTGPGFDDMILHMDLAFLSAASQ